MKFKKSFLILALVVLVPAIIAVGNYNFKFGFDSVTAVGKISSLLYDPDRLEAGPTAAVLFIAKPDFKKDVHLTILFEKNIRKKMRGAQPGCQLTVTGEHIYRYRDGIGSEVVILAHKVHWTKAQF